jgi:hypothetical protein
VLGIPDRRFDGLNLPSDGPSVLPIASGAERMKEPLGTARSREPKMSWATRRMGVRYHPLADGSGTSRTDTGH